MAYDIKFKGKAIEYYKKGNSIRKTAETYGISPNTFNTWLQEYKEEGKFIRKPKPANNTKLKEQDVLRYLENNPDGYQEEIAKHFGVSQSGVSKALRRFRITRKKDKAL